MTIIDRKLLEKLEKAVHDGVKGTLDYTSIKYSKDDIFTYVLYIDEDCTSLGWAANTYSHYEKIKKEFTNPNTILAIKWYYPYFALGLGKLESKFDKIFYEDILSILDEISEFEPEDDFTTYQAEIVDSIIKSFKFAIQNYHNKNITFFMTIVDSDNAKLMEDFSAKELNEESLYFKFIHRFEMEPMPLKKP